MPDKYGIPESTWIQTRAEVRTILIACARERRVLPYGKLAGQIAGIRFQAHDQRFFDMLGEISQAENADGRGMLSAVVVTKEGDMVPGEGFFELAKELGKDVADIDKCWLAEVRHVFDYWSNKEPKKNSR